MQLLKRVKGILAGADHYLGSCSVNLSRRRRCCSTFEEDCKLATWRGCKRAGGSLHCCMMQAGQLHCNHSSARWCRLNSISLCLFMALHLLMLLHHAGMAAGAYPPRELEWLITAAWNKGCNHQFFGRTQEAVELMCAAEALMEDCPALIAKQQVVAGP